MKSMIDRTPVVLGARLVVGAALVLASIDKIADPVAFAASIGNYQLIPHLPALVVATVLPWTELISGLFLVFGIFRRGAGLIAACLMAVFTALVISALARGLDIACGCFTQDPAAARIGWGKVLEDGTLFVLSLVAAFSPNSSISAERMIAHRAGGPAQR